MIINQQDYRRRVLGCWMGKNIGGTLGAPFEWKRQINDVTFYTQELGGDPLPNDDLDIQLLWLVALEERGLALDAHTLAEYWVLYVTPHWSEYGTGKINMRSGLVPPLCGAYHNIYKDSCGSFIRSEIWGCIAPGAPRIAARYAYEDAILDHGDGEGVYGEVFCAALEASAFVEQDIERLIAIGLSYIPAECAVARAVHAAIASYKAGEPWVEARDEMLRLYGGRIHEEAISPRDKEAGLSGTQFGWDVPCNIGMVIIGLLYGEGDFDRSLCLAVNCGEDTDCTGATVGAIWGLMHGLEAIPQKWIDPIGHKIVTACLNLGELGFYGNQIPATIDNLTARTERVAQQVILRHALPLQIADGPTDLAGLTPDALLAGSFREQLFENLGCPVFRFDSFEVAVDYDGSPVLRDGEFKTVRLRIRNTYKVQANLTVRWYAPKSWRVLPARSGNVFSGTIWLGANPQVIEFRLQAERVEQPLVRAVVEITSEGRPTVMLVPVMFLNGNLPDGASLQPHQG